MTHVRTATDPVVILGKRGVHDHAVRRAMLEVDRALFVAPEDMALANEDRPITVSEGQSLIAPGALAVLLEALSIVSGAKALIVGAGTGYVAAVASRLAVHVDALESDPELAQHALENLTKMGARGVRVFVGDAEELPEGGPYERILVAKVISEIPESLTAQLASGGVLVAPLGDRVHPTVTRVVRSASGELTTETLASVEFASRLGDVLVEMRIASRAKVEKAAREGDANKKRIGESLIASGALTEADLYLGLAAQHKLKAGHVEELLAQVDPAITRMVSRGFLERHRVLPLCKAEGRILVATTDPDAPLSDLSKALGTSVELILVNPTDYRRLWASLDLQAQAKDHPHIAMVTAPVETDLLARHEVDARCVALFENLLLDAVGERASDVHLERYGTHVRVRLRVDGDLRDVTRMVWTVDELVGVVNVIKVASGLDIAERRLPQGGRFRRHAGTQVFDLRVQTQPTLHGEHVVLRLLPQEQRLLTVEDLGFTPTVANAYRRMLESPAGLVLVVGPTGSGKTTTLYAALQILARDHSRKVLTVEDPIEYSIDNIQQSQTKNEIGFGFAAAMRAFVREDPDVILVGEIRDAETALEAIRASQTGHVVLSTLHCNDSTDAVQRLLDLGMHSNSVASELLSVFAQRLARRICPGCRRETTPQPEIMKELFPNPESVPKDFPCFVGAGCERCGGHGTFGRIAVVEHLVTGPKIRRAIARREPLDELRKAALEQGLIPMRTTALDLVRRGIIPLTEVPWVLSAERMAEERLGL